METGKGRNWKMETGKNGNSKMEIRKSLLPFSIF
jgi:hypothetical protein